mgnify:CR=1 FL=1
MERELSGAAGGRDGQCFAEHEIAGVRPVPDEIHLDDIPVHANGTHVESGVLKRSQPCSRQRAVACAPN